MNLRVAYFDAYKSLLNEKLEITHNCIGLVGINESGKTNVLRAIGRISASNNLSIVDSPKMSRQTDPHLRFEFSLDEEEMIMVQSAISEWCKNTSVDLGGLVKGELTVVYHVLFRRDSGEECRYFSLEGVKLPKNHFVLRTDASTNSYLVKIDDRMVPLENAVLMTNAEFGANDKLTEASSQSMDLFKQETKLQVEIMKLTEEHPESEEDESKDTSNEEESPDHFKSPELAEKEILLASLKKHREKIDKPLEEFDIVNLLDLAEDKLAELTEKRDVLQQSIGEKETSLAESPDASTLSDEQAKASATKKKTLALQRNKLRTQNIEIVSQNQILASLKQPLREKFTDEISELSLHLGSELDETLCKMLPKVVHWTYSDDYILAGETDFNEILEAESFASISRPLVNLFRIGLEVDELKDLKRVIEVIQSDSGERRRSEDSLNRKVHDFLKAVWPTYDQKIKIALEQERICVQFFDPNCVEASYYDMQERSQGCQTFVSFLLTVGAEAKQGVIVNTVLLLDEPETHLHPSGVRFMLAELKNAAKNGNVVVYATHSIFMIDKEEYDRHAIVKKQNEKTQINPSRKDRIGFFMQEEVLYSALDVNLSKEFASRPQFNIVLEGHGDAVLFEKFYDKALRSADRPYDLNKTSFYHGGKCSDIQKYFSQKPIQLGTTWIFILDSDEPANKLKKFIEGRYKQFLNQFIFVFQYTRDDLIGKAIQLEDLLTSNILNQALTAAAEEVDCEIDVTKIDMKDSYEEYSMAIAEGMSNKDEYKGLTKGHLNKVISEAVKDVTNKEQFSAVVPEYVIWAEGVIENINSYIATKKNTAKALGNN